MRDKWPIEMGGKKYFSENLKLKMLFVSYSSTKLKNKQTHLRTRIRGITAPITNYTYEL